MNHKHKLPLISLYLVIMTLTSQAGCQPNHEQATNEASVEFSFATSPKASNSAIFKSIENADRLIVSIHGGGGEVYPSSEIELYRFGDSYASQPISLVPGTYSLREFIVIDEGGDALYATPIEGSPMAHLVSDPLDIEFSVSHDIVTTVRPEIVATEGTVPEDFGYVSFGLDEDSIVDVIDFLLSVFVYDEAHGGIELTEADIVIRNEDGDDLYTGTLAAETNHLTVPAGHESYRLVITKSGFNGYSRAFGASELAGFFDSDTNGPLEVTLMENVLMGPPLVLWNKLGSPGEMASEEGVPAVVSGPIHFGNMVHEDGVALAAQNAQIRFDSPFDTHFPESGTIEFWWLPAHDENSSTGSHYDERVPLMLSGDIFIGGPWPTMRVQMAYRSHGVGFDRTFVQFYAPGGNQATLYYDLNFAAGDLLHVGITWEASDDTSPVKLYIDGVQRAPVYEYSINPAVAVAGIGIYVLQGNSYDLEIHRASKRLDGAANQFDSNQFIDNLKLWRYAKHDFSDRFTP